MRPATTSARSTALSAHSKTPAVCNAPAQRWTRATRRAVDPHVAYSVPSLAPIELATESLVPWNLASGRAPASELVDGYLLRHRLALRGYRRIR
jgi:hypothetical protein